MKKLFTFLLVPSAYLLMPKVVFAHCPLCVAGAAVGVTLTRWIGIDDSITGVWIAALLGSMSFWFSTWLLIKSETLRKWKYRIALKPIIYVLIFASTLWSFYKFQLIIRMSQLFGLDKLTFGMITGGILFYLIDMIKIKHCFNYQKIVISLGSMTVLSLLIYILINFYI
ncbi:MAG: hypothetical protein AAB622_02605 [Patescibacteria group bacterium]